MEVQRIVRIVNAAGLHARPCHAIVSAALEFEADLRIRCGEREVNGKSILELMTLNAATHAELRLTATGTDAEGLLERLSAMIAAGFDETL